MEKLALSIGRIFTIYISKSKK